MALEGLDSLLFDPVAAPRRRLAASSLPPIDDGSLFSAVGSGVASGFGAVANVLDTPFAFGRDLLKGRNPLPGIFDPDARTTTREFFGIEDDPDSWLDEATDIGLSIAFDPVTWLTGGAAALGKSGVVLRKAGLLDDLTKVASKKAGQAVGKRVARITTTPADVLMSIDEAARPAAMAKARDAAKSLGWDFDDLLAREGNKPVGGLFGTGLPLASERFTFGTFGRGKRSQQAAAAMDLLGERVRWSAPGRAVAKVFDKRVGDFADERSQRAASELWPIHEAARQDARQTGFQLVDQYDKILQGGRVKETDLEKILSRAIEYKEGTPTGQITADIANKFGGLDAADQQAMFKIVDDMRTEIASIKGLHDSIGLNLPELYDPFVDYAPRYLSDFFATRRRQQKLFNTFFESSQARQDILRAIPEGRSALDAMMHDARLVGKNRIGLDTAAKAIASDYGVADAAQAKKLAKFFARMPDDALGNNLFGSPVRDVLRYVESGVETHATGDYTQKYLAQFARPLEEVADAIALPSGGIGELPGTSISRTVLQVDPAEKLEPLTDVLKASGFTQGGRWVEVPDGLPGSPFTPTPAPTPGQALLEGPGGAVGQIGNAIPPPGTKRIYLEGDKNVVHPAAMERMAELLGVSVEDVGKMGVPADVANFVKRTMQPFTSTPAGMKPWLDASDWFLNSFKGLATGPFIAFHGRNFGSGQMRNWQIGALDPRDVKRVDALLRSNKPLAGIEKAPAIARMLEERGLAATAENGTQMFRELAYIYEVSGGHVSQPADVLGGAMEEFASQVPGRIPFSFKQTARAANPLGKGPDAWKPWQVRGGYDVFKREEVLKSKFALSVAGEQLGVYVENLNRLSPFATLIKGGMDPGRAAAMVTAAHGSYAARAFTKTENEVFRRLFPFFKFCVPVDHEALTINGWKTFNQIEEGELILGYDMETGRLEWTPCVAVNVFEHDGELIEVQRKKKHRTYTFQFTDEHRWPVRHRVREPATVPHRPRKYVNTRPTMVTGAELRYHDQLLCAGDFRGTKTVLSPRHAAILGWVVTDGYFRWRGSHCEMIVYQSPSKSLDAVVELLGTKPRAPHPDTGVVAVPVALEDAKAITTVFRDKTDLPSIVGRLSRESAEAMWEAMYLAEGDVSPKQPHNFFSQHGKRNRPVLDAFQILCLLTERTANIASQGCMVRKQTTYSINKKRLSRVNYRGLVWCPTTATGTWVMRHEGQVVITGNSANQTRWLVNELMERPGGRLAKTIRAVAATQQQDPFAPDYIKRGASIPLSPGPSGEPRYLAGLGIMEEDPLSFAGGGGGMELLSRLNPLIKGPMEAVLNQSFFQTGRPLSSLDPPIGRTIGNLMGRDKPVEWLGGLTRPAEQVIGNIVPRPWTTLRTLTDPRKELAVRLLNTTTGLRFVDVPEAARDQVVRQIAQDLLEKFPDAKRKVTAYIPKEDLEAMGESERAEAQRLLDLLRSLDQRGKARAAAREKSGE